MLMWIRVQVPVCRVPMTHVQPPPPTGSRGRKFIYKFHKSLFMWKYSKFQKSVIFGNCKVLQFQNGHFLFGYFGPIFCKKIPWFFIWGYAKYRNCHAPNIHSAIPTQAHLDNAHRQMYRYCHNFSSILELQR